MGGRAGGQGARAGSFVRFKIIQFAHISNSKENDCHTIQMTQNKLFNYFPCTVCYVVLMLFALNVKVDQTHTPNHEKWQMCLRAYTPPIE